MQQIKLNELKDGQLLSGFYLMTSFKVEPNKKKLGEYYYSYILRDKTKTISCKQWNGAADKEFPTPCIVKVNGEGNLFNNSINLVSKELFLAREGDHPFKLEDFIKSAPLSVHELKSHLVSKLKSINNTVLKNLVGTVLKRYWDEVDFVPAAKSVHHAYMSGLLFHKYEMCEIAEVVCKLRPYISRDYLIAGILLHDIAKVEELISELGIVSDYSRIGNLEGHISIVVENLTLDANTLGVLDTVEYRQLKHILLSHHGKLEWGSPVNPRLIEAIALHHIDNLDASIDTAQSALEELNEHEELATKVFGLDGSMIYRTH